MPYYLSRYVGAGTPGDPYRPIGSDQPGWSAIDLRPDGGRSPDGGGLNACLLYVPLPAADSRLMMLGEDPADSVGPGMATAIRVRVGHDTTPGRLGDALWALLLAPPANGWRGLDVNGGRYEFHLGGAFTRSALRGGAVLATDDFNRANQNPISSPWATANAVTNGMQIFGNTLWATANIVLNAAHYTGVTWPSDHYSQYRVAALGSGTIQGPFIRCQPATTFLNVYLAYMSSGAEQITKVIDGNETVLAAITAGAFVIGDVGRLQALGSTLRYFRNGVEAAGSPVTDTSLTGGRPGIWSSRNNTQADDWEGGSVAVVPTLVSSADTFRVHFGENLTQLLTVNASDAFRVAMDDSIRPAAILTLRAASDALAVALADVFAAMRAGVGPADPLAVAASDVGRVTFIAATALDALGPKLLDALGAILATLTVSDSVATAVQDAPAVAARLTSTDALAVALADLGSQTTATNFLALTATDTAAVTAADTARIFAALATSDTFRVALTETATGGAGLLLINASDTFRVVLGIPATGLLLVAASDALRVGVADVGVTSILGPPVIILSAEPVAPRLADLPSSMETWIDGELLALTLAVEQARVVIVHARTDTAGVTLTETAAIVVVGSLVAVAATDTLRAGMADTAAEMAAALAVSDAVAPAVADVGSVVVLGLVLIAATDGVAVGAGEIAALTAVLSVVDGVPVGVAETAAIVVSGLVLMAGTDALAAGLNEAAGLVAQLVAADVFAATLVELARLTALAVATDAVALALGDTVVVVPDVPLLSIVATDAASLKAIDVGVAVILTQSIDVAETLAVMLLDAGAILVLNQVILAADATALTLGDLSALFVALAGADAAPVALVDTAAVTIGGSVQVTASDAVGCQAAETTAVFVALADTDATPVGFNDAATITISGDVQVAAIDAFAVRFDDVNFTISATIAFDVSDVLALAAEDFSAFAIDAGDVVIAGTDEMAVMFEDEGLPAIIQETFDIDASDAFTVEATDEAMALMAALSAPTLDEVALALDDLGEFDLFFRRLSRVLVGTATLVGGPRTAERGAYA